MLTLSLPRSPLSGGSLTRRDFLAAGALPFLGLPLAALLRGNARAAEDSASRASGFGRAKSCAIIWLKGGPSQLDTFDMKPDAPSEIRGEFRAIRTGAPEIQVCEHLPRLAGVANRFALLRSMRLHGDAAHSTAAYEMTTGRPFPRSGEAVAGRDDHPHYGSVVSALSGRDGAVPSYVMLPDYLVVNGELRGGQNAGLLGGRHDPYVPGGDPRRPDRQALDLAFRSRVEIPRLNDRAKLLDALDRRLRALEADPELAAADAYRRKGLSILERGTLGGALVRRPVEGGPNSPRKPANPKRAQILGKNKKPEGRHLSERICPQARRAREAALRSRPSTERNEASGQRRRSNRPLFYGVLYLDLAAEPEATRARYGNGLLGQSTLLARRLLEAGVRLVQVNCMSTVLDPERNWDTHQNNFATLRDLLLPQMDRAVASLLEDLSASGLLEETLVLVMGEFGRAPRINPNAGRDHWPAAFTVLLAGAGIPGGRVFGGTDAQGAAPTGNPVLPGQLAATIYHALGIDPAQEIHTFEGRPYRLAEGEPVLDLWS